MGISVEVDPHQRSMQEQEKFTVEDIQRLQFDLVSTHAREIVPYILHAYDSVTVMDKDVKTTLEYFRNWNYEMRKEDVSTTLFPGHYHQTCLQYLP